MKFRSIRLESQLELLNDILDMSRPHIYRKISTVEEVYARVENVRDELLDMLADIPVSSGGDWSDMGNAID